MAMSDYENYAKQPRPVPVTIICILGFVSAGLALFILPDLLAHASRYPSWYLVFLVGSTAIGLGSMIAMWNMKKLGVFLYVMLTIVNQILIISAGRWSASALVPLAICGVALANVDRMD